MTRERLSAEIKRVDGEIVGLKGWAKRKFGDAPWPESVREKLKLLKTEAKAARAEFDRRG